MSIVKKAWNAYLRFKRADCYVKPAMKMEAAGSSRPVILLGITVLTLNAVKTSNITF
jgi:hypothetical protein